jgi:hypothetical protein
MEKKKNNLVLRKEVKKKKRINRFFYLCFILSQLSYRSIQVFDRVRLD